MSLRYWSLSLWVLTATLGTGCGAILGTKNAGDQTVDTPLVPPPPPGPPAEYYVGAGSSLPLREELTLAEIEAQFVTSHANVVSRATNELVLRFSDEWIATFLTAKTLKVPGGDITGSFARFADTAAKGKFISILDELKIRDEYLVKNELFEEEQFVYPKLLEPSAPLQTVGIPIDAVNALVPEKGSVSIVADQHGNQAVYDAMSAILVKPEIEWFGIEMLDHRLQATLDTFLTAPEGSSEAAAARAKLLDYYSHGWNEKFPDTGAENNHYLKLIERAKQRGIRVYAMDASAKYQLFRGEDGTLSLAARNYYWSKNIPTDGTGVVFGGAAHVIDLPGNNFQDYIHLRQARKIVIVR